MEDAGEAVQSPTTPTAAAKSGKGFFGRFKR